MANNTVSFDSSVDLHLGRLCLKNMKKFESGINQIEVCSDEVETNGSVRLKGIRVAEAFRKRGLGLGDVVMLCAANHSEIVLPIVGSILIGAAVQPLSTEMTPGEIRYSYSLGLPSVVVCDMMMAEIFANIAEELQHDIEIIVFGDVPANGKYTRFRDLIKPTGTENDFEPTELDPATTTAFIVCSSGTTGLPKGVCISHKAMASSVMLPSAHLLTDEEVQPAKGSFMNFSSIYWISGISSLMFSCLLGYTYIHFAEPYSFELTVKTLKKYKPTMIFLTPVSLQQMIKDPRIKEADFSSVKLAFAGGSAASHEILTALESLLINGEVATTYGMTESGTVCNSLTYKKDSVGLMNFWIKWRIVDPETEEEIKCANKVGELRVKADTIFTKYYNNPKSTAEAFDAENWLRTGDLFSYDEDGYFYLVDRIKEMIKYRNYQVAPLELENEIYKIPGVLLVAVVGVPHPVDGDLPLAFVEVCKGAKVTAQQVKDAVENTLSSKKFLRGGVVFLDKMPTTISGKVNRKVLNTMKLTAKPELKNND